MNIESEKKLAIQKAYGEHYEKLKDFINENGWCDFKAAFGDFGNSKGIGIELDVCNNYDPKYCYYKRPVSLTGIDDNNGWIKIIDGKTELGTEDCTILVIDAESKEIGYGYYSPSLKSIVESGQYSHYQKLVLPKHPIY